MKLFVIAALSCLAVLSFAKEEELPLADICDAEACQLPECRCSSTQIPGGLNARDTPQFVILTFDDGVNVLNIETYRDILYKRVNSNGCRAGTTFFVNHEYTNYQLVNELYNNGFEIALHSVSHQNNQTYWQHATYEDMVKEFGDQKKQMSHFANIPEADITGVRIPFLQMTGNASFQAMADHGLEYDSSWPTITYTNPGLWPYTLDYASIQDCVVPPCPTASIPKTWVQPMVSWHDVKGVPCSMVDSCFNIPDVNDADAWFEFILTNFERHYLNNRAPFGFFVHEWFINTNPGVREGLVRFMDLINQLNDVFMVNNQDVIAWTKNPVPLDKYVQQSCPQKPVMACPAVTCPVDAAHNGNTYWLAICNTCPQVYPWLGNPLGQNL